MKTADTSPRAASFRSLRIPVCTRYTPLFDENSTSYRLLNAQTPFPLIFSYITSIISFSANRAPSCQAVTLLSSVKYTSMLCWACLKSQSDNAPFAATGFSAEEREECGSDSLFDFWCTRAHFFGCGTPLRVWTAKTEQDAIAFYLQSLSKRKKPVKLCTGIFINTIYGSEVFCVIICLRKRYLLKVNMLPTRNCGQKQQTRYRFRRL